MMSVTELKDNGNGTKGIINYLTESISDAPVTHPNSLSDSTKYYATNGTPPGVWMGSGINAFDGIQAGGTVSASQLEMLIGYGQNPVTGEQLGLAFRKVTPRRIDENFIRQIDEAQDLAPELSKRILNSYLKENSKPAGSVHAFDYTFSPMKDVSVLWGLGDNGVREIIEQAHHDAIQRTLDRLEATALYTRTGEGGATRAKTRGLVAARYDHWDSREGDPHLHSHVVVANKVQTEDGRWLTIDSRGGVFPSAVALSEHYDNTLMDILSARLGVEWQIRETTRSGKPVWGIEGVSEDLIQEFSTRHRKIAAARDSEASRKDDRKAWEDTRPAKQRFSLQDLRAAWAQRAGKHHVEKAVKLDAAGRGLATLDDLDAAYKKQLGLAALKALEESKSSWSRWNVVAEVERASREVRLAWGRDTLVEEVTDQVLQGMVELNPGEAPQFRKWSTQKILDAEESILTTSNLFTSKALDHRVAVENLEAWRSKDGWQMSRSQSMAAWEILTSGRTCDMLVGPAGAGKTTTLSGLVDTWRAHGGNVFGYAPSAVAAKVLKESTGDANTIASWIHAPQRPEFTKNTLVIIDEATMAGTLDLAQITQAVKAAGGKILLVGDPEQLNAVEAGGVFAMLTREHVAPPSLAEVRRFSNEWEAGASLKLREGNDLSVVAAYLKHERIRGGDIEQIEQEMFEAWWQDTIADKDSLMLAVDNGTVTRLNAAAQTRLMEAGSVMSKGLTVELRDGNRVRVGDKIVTRRNARKAIHDEVINGATFRVKAVNPDGTILVSPAGKNTLLTLPAQYVSEHVDLGYAGTIHRAQGRTVDTCHTMITDKTSANSLYVGMTRGRESNMAWAVTSKPQDPDGPAVEEYTGVELFTKAIQNREDNRTALEIKKAQEADAKEFIEIDTPLEQPTTEGQPEPTISEAPLVSESMSL